MHTYWIIINENMHDWDAWIETMPPGDRPVLTSGWERIYAAADTLAEAEDTLREAKDWLRERFTVSRTESC